ncbi:uncharacterized protein LOC101852331 [Aplysia californica]|uniref:Uncharacterized protein LOC101852331 n=1 Tax=Aplysia californica TaxID=6500 RepID=A0ABM1A314_APLCA|nr:uncharacterized protein LOC101852331 [Aplysia californica]
MEHNNMRDQGLERTTYVLDTIDAVAERVRDLWESLQYKEEINSIAAQSKANDSIHAERENRASAAGPSSEPSMGVWGHQLSKKKKKYVDEEMTKLVPVLEGEVRKLEDAATRAVLLGFINHFKRLQEFERELGLERDEVLGEIKDGLVTTGQQEARRPSVTAEQLEDEIGDPEFHNRINGSINRFQQWVDLENRMEKANDMIKNLEGDLTKGKLDREKTMSNLRKEQEKKRQQGPSGLLQEVKTKLESAYFRKLTAEEQSSVISSSLAIIDTVQKESVKANAKGDQLESELEDKKRQLAVLRSKLNNHPGLMQAKANETAENDIKAMRKRQLSGYCTSLCSLLQQMEKGSSRARDDRERDQPLIKKLLQNVMGVSDALADLCGKLENAGFDDLGGLDPDVLDVSDLCVQDERAVSQLKETVFELLDIQRNMGDNIKEIKRAANNPGPSFLDRGELIKSLGKFPNRDEAQEAHVMSCAELMTASSADFVKFMTQKFQSLDALQLIDTALYTGRQEALVLRYNLLHQFTAAEIKRSPSGSRLHPLPIDTRAPAPEATFKDSQVESRSAATERRTDITSEDSENKLRLRGKRSRALMIEVSGNGTSLQAPESGEGVSEEEGEEEKVAASDAMDISDASDRRKVEVPKVSDSTEYHHVEENRSSNKIDKLTPSVASPSESDIISGSGSLKTEEIRGTVGE